jgi:arginase
MLHAYKLKRSFPALAPAFKRGLNIIKSGHANGQPNKGVIRAPSILLDHHNLIERIEKSCKYDDIAVTNTHGYFDDYVHLTIGGDHMVAYDSIAYQLSKIDNKRFGLVWIDAHSDINTIDTTNSFNKHGMVVSNLMKIDNTIKKKCEFNKLLSENIVYIGLRDVEQKERYLIDEYGIENVSSHEIHMMGIQCYINWALQCVLKDCDHIHISFDVDVMDPSIFPATGTPVPDGLSYKHVMDCARIINNDLRVKSMDIVEYDPSKDDKEYSCGLLCNDIIVSTLT